ncbi:hypothetical protein HPC49_12360 [Pyxidicoccus fallax]|uniref:Uncharacterized protein n=1 Tax=Pyxidicoccus fallax TaxID=394095 RepID=A0A848LTD2_9BACT|nr:hypothetical protein [Pyxidicoccus fallax]NMO20654.1 hypothetical protein [Pyxidicoccus fallax]NPC79027.1 hypothetical protein [Pyxidicoccus fallax]
MLLRWLFLLVWVVLPGCSGPTRVVRLDTGRSSPVVHVPRSEQASEPVELDEDDVKEAVARLARTLRPSQRPEEAARRLFEVDSRSGSYLFDVRSRRITPLRPGEHLAPELPRSEVELTRSYLRWCERTGRSGDCLGLLKEGPVVMGDARFTLALALAKGAVLDELWEAVKDMAHPEALMQAALWTAATYALLWTVPEPATKGVAAVLTAALIIYVGVDTFWGLIQGFRQLMAESDRAVTFDELREAGERFGKVMGRNAARAFVMLATAAIGSTGATLGTTVRGLPGAAQAAVRAEAQAGVVYTAVGQVETVAVAADGFTFALAPGAVAMSSSGTGTAWAATGTRPASFHAWKSMSGFKYAMGAAGPGKQWHHIVEQTPGNVRRFGPEALHNTENVIPLDEALHTRVSAFYSSKQPELLGTSSLTVRQWLSTQSYQAQREFGLLAIENIQKGIWK